MAALTVLVLNAPLLLQMGGWEANDVVWFAMPALAATVTMVLASGFGPALARTMALLEVECRVGQPLVTSRMEELQALRRG